MLSHFNNFGLSGLPGWHQLHKGRQQHSKFAWPPDQTSSEKPLSHAPLLTLTDSFAPACAIETSLEVG